MNKVLLSGLVVTLLFTLLPLLLPMIGLEGLDYSWLADGNITVGELVAFAGSILIAISEPGRNAIKGILGIKDKKR